MSTNTCSVDAIAKVLGLSPRRVQALARAGVIPKPEHGKYSIAGCIMGYNKYIAERSNSKDDSGFKVNKARTRLLEAQAAKAEMELKALSKDYVKVEQVEKDWSNVLLTFRARILSVPYRAATLLTGITGFHEIEDVLKKLLHEALNELSEYDPGKSADSTLTIATAETPASQATTE